MAENGKKPAITSCVIGCRYQEVTFGISLDTLLVLFNLSKENISSYEFTRMESSCLEIDLQGGLKSFVKFRPTMAPTTVIGKCTNNTIEATNYAERRKFKTNSIAFIHFCLPESL